MNSTKTNCGIYKIANTNDGKIYIGSSSNLKSRKYSHFRSLEKGCHKNKHLQNSYNLLKVTYGSENVKNYFSFEIIKYVEKIDNKKFLREELLKWEQYYLNEYLVDGAVDSLFCYNFRPYVESMLGFEHSEETKEKLRQLMLSELNPRRGKKYSEEHRNNISEAIKGRKHSEETKQKLRQLNLGANHPNYGRSLSEETKNKISRANKGNEKIASFRKGKKLSEESKNKISKANKGLNGRKVINIDTEEVFNSMSEAAKKYGVSDVSIRNVCLGKLNNTKGIRVKFYE